ncbi:MAG TPA: hypothetical protein DCF97_03945 [Plesiomonas shigelloides]|nr:hypothetical protein [Plesiomonas shigelloides]
MEGISEFLENGGKEYRLHSEKSSQNELHRTESLILSCQRGENRAVQSTFFIGRESKIEE